MFDFSGSKIYIFFGGTEGDAYRFRGFAHLILHFCAFVMNLRASVVAEVDLNRVWQALLNF